MTISPAHDLIDHLLAQLPGAEKFDELLPKLGPDPERINPNYLRLVRRLVTGSPFWVKTFDELSAQHAIPAVFLSDGYSHKALVRAFKELAKVAPTDNTIKDKASEATLSRFIAAEELRLREQRQQFMLLAIWIHAEKLLNLAAFMRILSQFADEVLQYFTSLHYQQLIAQHGEPVDGNNAVQHFGILALGKLGGYELNLSSDIDCLFFFGRKGRTQGRKSISNQEFFEKLGRRLINSIQTNRGGKFIFRMDLRLRPFGASGALASSLSSLENYYEKHGRAWERFALVKARVCAHSSRNIFQHQQPIKEDSLSKTQQDCIDLMNLIHPFVYRAYTDFSLLDSLRELKTKIRAESRRRQSGDAFSRLNIKLGEGGIRDVEFIAQSLQLIHGGKEKSLQTVSLNQCLKALERDGHLLPEQAQKLQLNYNALRNAEHSLQAIDDQQTQTIPDDQDDIARFILLENASLTADVNLQDAPDDERAVREYVERLQHSLMKPTATFFDEFLKTDLQDDAYENDITKTADNKIDDSSEDSSSVLQKKDFIDKHVNAKATFELWLSAAQENAEKPESHRELRRLFNDFYTILGTTTTDTILSKFHILLRQLFQDFESQEYTYEQLKIVLTRLQTLFGVLVKRGVYIDLLKENKQAREQLLKLSLLSEVLPYRLAEHPQLLDELLQPASLYTLPDRNELRSDLDRSLLRIDAHDSDEKLQDYMIAMRDFKHRESLRAAICELTGTLPLTKVSDYLSFLAEVILQRSLEIVWEHMHQRYGSPDGHMQPSRFAVLAMGKLGGLELSHSSDLDLVFIHDWPLNLSVRKNEGTGKALELQVWLIRLAQKLIWFLTTRLMNDRLYEVDMRLRPSGNSGLLVSSIAGFEKYQRESAWVWEHQALLRSRVVAGEIDATTGSVQGASFSQRIEALRLSLLTCASEKHEAAALKEAVITMRGTMAEHLAPKDDELSVKHSSGGMVDIEFLTQYWCLLFAKENQSIIYYSDNLRQLEAIKRYYPEYAQDCDTLVEAYITLRGEAHKSALGYVHEQSASNKKNARMNVDRAMSAVRLIWRKHMLDDSKTAD